MSDRPPPEDLTPAERDELLAAEYVLGVLPEDERRSVSARADVDGSFATRIALWERRLAILNEAYGEGPVSEAVLPRVEAALWGSPGDTPAAAPRRAAPWRLWLAGLAVAAGVVLALLFWPQPLTVLQARLDAGELVFAANFDGETLRIDRSGPGAEAGRDYELWAIGDDGVPRSLGLIRGESESVGADLAAGITLAVSLEPEGGAPDGAPTGPVLAAAVLAMN